MLEKKSKEEMEQKLKDLQSLNLEQKIAMTKNRIEDWYEGWGGNVYISVSGGKDSVVLYYIARELYPDIPAVFVDTGLEYPENKEFINEQLTNVETIRPKMSFRKVIEKYGWPFPSKMQAKKIHEYRHSKSKKWRKRLMKGDEKGRFALSDKWKHLINGPYEFSHRCCYHMKKAPFKQYEKRTNRRPIIGTMASEGYGRKFSWVKYGGCNAFDMERPKSRPIGFWMKQDVLQYLKETGKPYSKVYGDIVENEEGELETTGLDRTGCMYCMFGVHKEEEPNRFQRMEKTHPKIHDYCMNNLGMKEVLEYLYIPWTNDEDKLYGVDEEGD